MSYHSIQMVLLIVVALCASLILVTVATLPEHTDAAGGWRREIGGIAVLALIMFATLIAITEIHPLVEQEKERKDHAR